MHSWLCRPWWLEEGMMPVRRCLEERDAAMPCSAAFSRELVRKLSSAGEECCSNLIPVLLAGAATAVSCCSDASLTWFKKMLLVCSLKDSTNHQNYGLFYVCSFKELWQLWAASGFLLSITIQKKRFGSLFHDATEAQHLGDALGAWLEHRAFCCCSIKIFN